MATVDDSASKARGLSSQFEDGQTMLALIAAHYVFAVTDGLSCSLQSSIATTVCGSMHEPVQSSLTQLRYLRSDEFFLKVWREAQSKIAEYELCEIKLPRHVRPPKWFDQQGKTAPAHKSTSVEEHFRVQYYAFLDGVIGHQRFDQPGMKTYCEMESVLLSACRNEDVSDGVRKLCE